MDRLRIVTYNIDGGANERLDRIARVLARIDADIVALTEADDREAVATLAGRLGMQHVWERGSGTRHVATLARWPARSSRIHRTPPLTQAALETTYATPAGDLTVFSLHLLPFLLLPFEIRRWQAVGRLLDIVREARLGPHLIVGDLNAIARGDRVRHRRNPARMRRLMAMQLFVVFRLAVPRLVRAGYVDCFRRLHPRDPGFTFLPGNLTTRYDYVLADPHMARRLRTCEVIDVPEAHGASDHLPLVAEFDAQGGFG